jgi:hypothetical protein
VSVRQRSAMAGIRMRIVSRQKSSLLRNYTLPVSLNGACASVVFEGLATSRKVKGSSPCGHCIFSICLILPAALGPEVHSASDRNEYQKQENKCVCAVERGRCVGLITLPPCVSRSSRQRGNLDISQSYGPPWPATGIASLCLQLNKEKRLVLHVLRIKRHSSQKIYLLRVLNAEA